MNLKKIKVKDIMTEIIISIPQDAAIKDAAHLMLRDRISGLLVIDNKKKIVGVITLTDFLKIIDRIATGGSDDFLENLLHCRTLKVADVMTRKVHSLPPEAKLEEAVRIMVDKNIHTFPVMKNKRLLGVIGRRDIINAVFYFSEAVKEKSSLKR